jgi:cold shock CspA family protein
MELAESQTTPDPGPGPIPGELVGEEGEVVRYVAERGFGFIACSDREVFFHLSNVFDVQDVEIVPGLPVWFTSDSQDGKERATFVASTRPTGLQEPPRQDFSAAVVAEPVGDRGFGFVLSPVHGRVLLHKSVLLGAADNITLGTRVDIKVESGVDGRMRATSAVLS